MRFLSYTYQEPVKGTRCRQPLPLVTIKTVTEINFYWNLQGLNSNSVSMLMVLCLLSRLVCYLD